MESTRAVRGLCLVTFLLLLATPGRLLSAEPVAKQIFKSECQPGSVTRVEVALQVGGDLKLVTDGAQKKLPMSVVANLAYDEQLLANDDNARPNRSLRFYDDAMAVIKVDKGGEKPTLDNSRRLIVVEKREKSAPELYCPTAGLSREELDLIEVPGNSLIINELLPDKPVAPGDSWKLADSTLANLLGLDAVSWTDVTSALGQVTDGMADFATAGSLQGAVGGVSTDIELKAKYRFDVAQKRIVYLALLVKEKRDVGHIGPGLDTVAKLIVKISPSSGSQSLAAAAAEIPLALTPELARLTYTSTGRQFRFLHDRRWFLTTEDSKLAVFRLLDRGELVAQCNVSALPAGKAKPATLAEFQRDVQDSLGKNFGQFVNASQYTSEAGYSVLRLVVHGNVSQLPIEWVYYLVSDAHGHRISLAFTLEESLKRRFEEADRALVNGLRLADPVASTAAKPQGPTGAQQPQRQ
jgi:hypothetical protein